MLILHLAGAGEPTALFTSENGRETTLRSPRPGRQVAMPSGWLDMAVDPASRRAFDAYVDQVGAQVQHSQPLLIKSLLTRMEWAGLSPGPWMAVKQVCMRANHALSYAWFA